MPSVAVQELQVLSNAIDSGVEPTLKSSLARVAIEVNTRLQSSAPASTEYISAAIKTLRKIGGLEHYELRINCLMDASQYFYLAGETFNALDPATSAVEI